MRLKHFLLVITLFLVQETKSQEKCECCAYHSFVYAENLDGFFNPREIRAKRIKTAIIFTIENDSSLKTNKYIQAKFHFDNEGRIIVKKVYYQGKSSTITDFVRNSQGRITKEIETHMDSMENRDTSMGSDINDYTYDTRFNLLCVKKRDYNGKVLPDNASEYTKYEYDNLNRTTREYRYTYYEANNIYIYDKTTKYSTPNKSESETLYNGKPWMKSTSKYDNNSNLINQIEYSLPELKMVWEEYYSYNDNNQIISFIRKKGIGFTECPDEDNFTEEYQYSSDKLLEKITHKYHKVVCEMIITYEE